MSQQSERPLPACAASCGEVIRVAGVRLELGHCCHHELSWECEFERRSDAAQVALALVPQGYVVSVDRGFVVEIAHPDGQTLVVVPRTGRVQLRLPYTTPAAERRSLATTLAQQIGAAVSSLRF